FIKHFKVFSEVNDVAEKHGADMVIMGSHGKSGIIELFVGYNNARLVRNANISVFVVKKDIKNITIKKAVMTCDSLFEINKAYLNAKKTMKKLGFDLHIVQVNLPNNSFRSSEVIEKQAVNFFTEADGNLDKMRNVHYICDYTAEEGVLHFANKINADLIVVPTHGRKGLAHFLEGSVSEDIANHANLPVMTFKI